MKAYSVTDKNECAFSTIVFAETAGKARAIAQHTDACEDVDFTDIRAIRVPALDDAYQGRQEMDWMDDNDRVRMVKDAGYRCSYEVSISETKCRECPAFEWCDGAEEYREEGGQ